MKIAAVICNIILFGFICLVLVSEGPSKEAIYTVFTIWWLLTLIISAVVISRSGASRIIRDVAIICNIVFLGFIGWALVDQYPHPNEPGFIPFVILMVLTPILNLVVLFLRTARIGRPMKTT